MLKLRAALLQTIRAFFAERDYLEVETPLLSTDTVVDAHIDPFLVTTSAGQRLSLQTSPEAAMKRLLAAGSPSIFQITKSLRQGETGSHHNPEFTIIEWYGVGTTWQDQIQLTQELLHACVRIVNPTQAAWWLQPCLQTTYRDAFRRVTGLDVLVAPDDEIRQVVNQGGDNAVGEETSRDDCLNQILAEHVEPTLGCSGPEFLCDYPASQAALARLSPEDHRVAQRFELYARGTELCNGYQELTDATELRQREQQQTRLRQQRSTSSETHRAGSGQSELHHALDGDTVSRISADAASSAGVPFGASLLIAAMDHGLPECSGVALGFDRLLMVLTGQRFISDVIPFPLDRA